MKEEKRTEEQKESCETTGECKGHNNHKNRSKIGTTNSYAGNNTLRHKKAATHLSRLTLKQHANGKSEIFLLLLLLQWRKKWTCFVLQMLNYRKKSNIFFGTKRDEYSVYVHLLCIRFVFHLVSYFIPFLPFWKRHLFNYTPSKVDGKSTLLMYTVSRSHLI